MESAPEGGPEVVANEGDGPPRPVAGRQADAAEGGQPATDDVSRALLRTFTQCLICWQPARLHRLHVCDTGGHYTCEQCALQVGHICRVCNNGRFIVAGPNPLFTRLAHLVHDKDLLSCVNDYAGCKVTKSYSSMLDHERNCVFGDDICPMVIFSRIDVPTRNTICRTGIPTGGLERHCLDYHTLRRVNGPALENVHTNQSFVEYKAPNKIVVNPRAVKFRVRVLLSDVASVGFANPYVISVRGNKDDPFDTDRVFVLTVLRNSQYDHKVNIFEVTSTPRFRSKGKTSVTLGIWSCRRGAYAPREALEATHSQIALWPKARGYIDPWLECHEGFTELPLTSNTAAASELLIPRKFLLGNYLLANYKFYDIWVRLVEEEHLEACGRLKEVKLNRLLDEEVGDYPLVQWNIEHDRGYPRFRAAEN